MSFTPEDFRRRISGEGIDLTPEKVEVEPGGYIISIVGADLPASLFESLKHILIGTYTVATEGGPVHPVTPIKLQVTGQGEYLIGEYEMNVDKYKRIVALFRRYGLSVMKELPNGEVIEMEEEDLISTVTFTHNRDISDILGVG